MKLLKNMAKKGITLIEMVVMIVVLSVAIPTLLRMWADVAWRSVRSEAMADATFYAQDLLEEIKSKKFDEISVSPRSSTLGSEPGESRLGTGNASFDDADDYNNYSDSPAAGYNRSVTVDYVRLGSGNIWESCGSVNCQNITDCTQCNACCYKRIRVTVGRANLATDVSLATVVSAH